MSAAARNIGKHIRVNFDVLRDSTIVFDLDGTLVDTAPDLVGATNHALGDLGLAPRPAAELKPWISFGARRMITEALLTSTHLADETEVDRLLALFLGWYEANIARESRPFPGVLDALDALAQRGARLAICTNKREALTLRLLTELGIAGRFDAIVGRDTLAVSKPHPGHLLGTIARAGGAPQQAVMIGDSEVDIATARAARVPVVAVTFGYSQSPVAELAPDVLLDDYAMLVEHLPRLLTAT